MIVQLLLFNLSEGTTLEDFLAFDQRVLDQYTTYLAPAKQRYLGVFAIEDSSSFSYAEVTLIDAESIEAARDARRALLPDPPEMEAIFDECNQYMTDAALLGMVAGVPSPNVTRTFNLDRSLIQISLSHLEASKSFEEITEFDRRVTEPYSAHMRQINWYYTGIYRIDNMPGYDFAEFDIAEAASVADIKAREAALETPEDMQVIFQEYHTYFGMNRSRFWLVPLQLNPAFKSSLNLTALETTSESQ